MLAQHLRKGFEYAKQRCTAYPRYVVQRRLFPAFLETYLPVVQGAEGDSERLYGNFPDYSLYPTR